MTHPQVLVPAPGPSATLPQRPRPPRPSTGRAPLPRIVRPLRRTAPTGVLDDAQQRRQLVLVRGLVVASVVLERFVVPLGSTSSLPVLLPVALVALGVGLRQGLFQLDRNRAGLFVLAAAACSATALVNLLTQTFTSTASFGYLLATYLPFAFVATHPRRRLALVVLETYATTAAVVGAIGMLQVGLQLAHVLSYHDYLAQLVPGRWLAAGFNTSYPLHYGSPIDKANGLLCLEPSLLSQVCGLGALCVLTTRTRRWRLVPLLVGMVATVAGTGMVLLAVGIVVLTLRLGLRAMVPALATLGVAAAVAATTPLGDSITQRVGEVHQQGSSTSLRFGDPFVQLGPAITSSVRSFLVGAGPGATDRYFYLRSAGQVVPVVPVKATYEYGAIAAAALVIAVLWAAFAGSPSLGVTAGAVVAWGILGGTLLLPAIVMPLWLLTSLPAGSGRLDLTASSRPPGPVPSWRDRRDAEPRPEVPAPAAARSTS